MWHAEVLNSKAKRWISEVITLSSWRRISKAIKTLSRSFQRLGQMAFMAVRVPTAPNSKSITKDLSAALLVWVERFHDWCKMTALRRQKSRYCGTRISLATIITSNCSCTRRLSSVLITKRTQCSARLMRSWLSSRASTISAWYVPTMSISWRRAMLRLTTALSV